MSYKIEDLKPYLTAIEIADRELEFSLLTLRKQLEITNLIGDINNLNKTLTKNPLILFDIIWILLVNKTDFKNKKEFKNFVLSQAKTSEVAECFKNKIDEILVKSQPKIKNVKKYDELLKINQAQNDIKVCYGAYYDRVAKRYGYSIDDFFDLTIGQLHLLLHVSSDQAYEEIEVQAALQGRKLKSKMKYEDLEEKEDKKLDDNAQDLLKRLQAEYKAKQGKK